MTDSYQEGQMISEEGEEDGSGSRTSGILEQQQDDCLVESNWADQGLCARLSHHVGTDQVL